MSTRKYDASRRQEAAARTRGQILDAGRQLFVDQGYAATTMGDVAALAGVAPATANAAFGGKAGLLKRLIDVGVAGDDEDIPVSEREVARNVAATKDPAEQCRLLAEFISGVHERLADLQDVMLQASGVDEQVRDLSTRAQQGRHEGMMEFVALVSQRALKKGLTREHAADLVWALTEPRLYTALVRERGWSQLEYQDWLNSQLQLAVLR